MRHAVASASTGIGLWRAIPGGGAGALVPLRPPRQPRSIATAKAMRLRRKRISAVCCGSSNRKEREMAKTKKCPHCGAKMTGSKCSKCGY
jgi:hypothetical protein